MTPFFAFRGGMQMGISSAGEQNVIQTLVDDRIGIKTNHTRGDVRSAVLKSFLKKSCRQMDVPSGAARGQNGRQLVSAWMRL